MASTPLLSVVMPCLNEARTVGICIEKAFMSFRQMGLSGEVIVADNGSEDGSPQIAERHGARVVHQPLKGYGAALTAGLQAANGRYLIMGDSDDSYDWSDIGRFVQRLNEGCDLVMGNRFKGGIEPGAMPWHHRYIGNPVLSLLARIAFQVPIGDFHCGMRAFTREAFQAMRPDANGMEFATEMIANAARLGLRIKEVPIKLHPDGRDRPPHLRSFRDGWRHLRYILTYAPDHLYLLPGTGMLALGLILQILLATGPITVSGQYFGIHFLALGGLLSLVGFNLLSMGLLTKGLLSLRYPKLRTARVSWALDRFTVERGLVLGLSLCLPSLAVLGTVLVIWLENAEGDMNFSVHPVFTSAQIFALGLNIMFLAFALQLLRSHLVEMGKKTD